MAKNNNRSPWLGALIANAKRQPGAPVKVPSAKAIAEYRANLREASDDR
ncbi:MAG TPA: hypothetical protein VF389_11590 [Woeseiaceae bacterium]